MFPAWFVKYAPEAFDQAHEHEKEDRCERNQRKSSILPAEVGKGCKAQQKKRDRFQKTDDRPEPFAKPPVPEKTGFSGQLPDCVYSAEHPDGGEGARFNNVFATYSHGCLLPKNPALCDHILQTALAYKYGDVTLPSLDDTLENSAHLYMKQRLEKK